MMSSARALVLVAVAVAISACSKEAGEDAAQAEMAAAESVAPEWMTTLATIANAVERQPLGADSILQAHGMTRAAFDSLIYEVAADSALTAQFEQARQDR